MRYYLGINRWYLLCLKPTIILLIVNSKIRMDFSEKAFENINSSKERTKYHFSSGLLIATDEARKYHADIESCRKSHKKLLH